jgi:phosphoribosylformylglycinamidine synthase
MVGLIGNLAHRRTMGFPGEGLLVVLLGETGEDLGGSEYLRLIHGLVAGSPPRLDLDLEKRVQTACIEAIRRGMVLSAHDCSEGGVALALLECCCAGGVGASLRVETGLPPHAWLFGESQSRFVVTVTEEDLDSLRALAGSRQIPLSVLGKTGGNRLVVNDWIASACSTCPGPGRRPWSGY